MFTVDDNVIHLTRGDTARFDLAIHDLDGMPYELQPNEKAVFTVKKNAESNEILFQQEIVDNEIKINPADTKNWDFGQYVFDVQISSDNKNYIDTIIPPTPLIIEKEVNF